VSGEDVGGVCLEVHNRNQLGIGDFFELLDGILSLFIEGDVVAGDENRVLE
jgi:hypothetical protein